MNLPHRLLVGVAAYAITCGFAGVAHAGGDANRPPADAAISVYVEQVPTGSGSVAAGASAGKASKLGASLEAKVRREAGNDARALIDVATSPSLGGPPAPVKPTPVKPTPVKPPTAVKPSTHVKPAKHVKSSAHAKPPTHVKPPTPVKRSAPAAISPDSVGSSMNGRLIGLVAALLAATLVVGLLALQYRARGRRPGRRDLVSPQEEQQV
jgi:hypothetical protein